MSIPRDHMSALNSSKALSSYIFSYSSIVLIALSFSGAMKKGVPISDLIFAGFEKVKIGFLR